MLSETSLWHITMPVGGAINASNKAPAPKLAPRTFMNVILIGAILMVKPTEYPRSSSQTALRNADT